MYDELVKRLRECTAEQNGEKTLWHQAADAIEELQQTVEHYKGCADDWYDEACEYKAAVPKWIPVTERLPLYCQDVLAVRTYGDGKKCQEVLMVHIAVSNEETGEKWWNATNITHWMPLPEPPKEDA